MAFPFVILPLNAPAFPYLLASKILIAADSFAALKPFCRRQSSRRLRTSMTQFAINRYVAELAPDSVFYPLMPFIDPTFSNTSGADSFAACDSFTAGFAAAIGSIVAVAPSFFPPRPRRKTGFFLARELPLEASDGFSSWSRTELCTLCE